MLRSVGTQARALVWSSGPQEAARSAATRSKAAAPAAKTAAGKKAAASPKVASATSAKATTVATSKAANNVATAAASSGASAIARVTPERSFQLEKVLEKVGPKDLVFAKQEGMSIFSFLSFKGMRSIDCATRLLAIPEGDRNFHTVFGRADGAKMDFAADLDFPYCKVGKTDKGYYTGESVVLEALAAIREFFEKQARVPAPTDIMVLDGHSKQRHSFHLHVRSEHAHFTSFQAMREVAAFVNARLPMALVDVGVYRPRGTMRVAYCPKYSEKWRSLLPYTARDDALVSVLKPMHELSKEAVMERSFIVHPEAGGKVLRGTGASAEKTGVDEFGNKVPKFLLDSKKWMRYQECVAALARLPDSYADDYHTWVRVGLSLHAFAEDGTERPKNDWKNFSARCRGKYNPAHCDALWVVFAKRQNAFNWRRGYFYLIRKVRTQEK